MPETELGEMELNGTSLNADYYSIDELDPEALEDVEVALYGMLHHASNDEDFVANSENYPLSATISQKGKDKLDISTCIIPENQNKENPISPFNMKSNLNSRQPKQVTEHSECNKLPSPTKSPSTRTSENNKQCNLKKNPYSQVLVIEESNTKWLKKKSATDCEVITLSDEEDSKYASINKSAKKRIPKMDYKGAVTNLNIPQLSSPVASTISLTEDSESDLSDSSVIMLNPKPSSSRKLNMGLFSDSSNSEIEVLNPIKPNYDTVNLKLNVKQGDDHHSSSASYRSLPTLNSWEQYSSAKWTPEMIKFYDKDGNDTDLQGILNSFPKNVKWYLSDEDRLGSSLQRNRYFGKSAKVRCANCNQWDHLTRNCREPRKISNCSICGMPGHKAFGCPKKVCLGCGRPSKILIECCPECRRESNITCMICRSKHVTQRCPDLWRRYHSTTSEQGSLKDTGAALKPHHSLYCCNCAGRGHLVHECPGKLWSKYSPANPTIFSYENSEHFLNDVTKNGKSSVVVSEDRKEVWVVGPSPDKSPQRGGRQLYYTSIDQSEFAMRKARASVLQEIKHVEINWRKQLKKGRMLVEFTGKGNTIEAKMRFKKLITSRKRVDSTPTRKDYAAVQENPNPTTSNLEKGKTLLSPKKNQATFSVTAVDVIHLSHDGKQLRQHVRVSLHEKQKQNVGKLLGKLENRNHVQITSCHVGSTWEITIHKLTKGKSMAALNSVLRYLNSASSHKI